MFALPRGRAVPAPVGRWPETAVPALAPVRRNRPNGRYNRRAINRVDDGRRNAQGRARAREGAQPDERPVKP